MTNNDEMALNSKLKHALDVWDGKVCMTAKEIKFLLSLLEERDADKKQLAAMSQAFLNLKLLADVYLHAYEEAKASVTALEARTVSVKFPERCECCYSEQEAALFDGIVEEYTEALKTACAEAGIKLDVGE